MEIRQHLYESENPDRQTARYTEFRNSFHLCWKVLKKQLLMKAHLFSIHYDIHNPTILMFLIHIHFSYLCAWKNLFYYYTAECNKPKKSEVKVDKSE